MHVIILFLFNLYTRLEILVIILCVHRKFDGMVSAAGANYSKPYCAKKLRTVTFIAVIYIRECAFFNVSTHARTPGNRSVFTAVLVIDTRNAKLVVGAPTSHRILAGTINNGQTQWTSRRILVRPALGIDGRTGLRHSPKSVANNGYK